MSSYFDKAQQEASQSIEDAISAECDMVIDVLLVTGDREFPDDLREKITAKIAIEQIKSKSGSTKGREWYESLGCSKLIDSLHSLFHELGSRRIETRFGVLNDRPSSILAMRENYINIHESTTLETHNGLKVGDRVEFRVLNTIHTGTVAELAVCDQVKVKVPGGIYYPPAKNCTKLEDK